MKTKLAAFVAILLCLCAAVPANAIRLIIDAGDRAFYTRGAGYWDNGVYWVWIPGHWAGPRHHHWIHGHYARR